MNHEELMRRLTAVCPEELEVQHSPEVLRPTAVSLTYKKRKGRAAVRISDYRLESGGVVIRMWPEPSTLPRCALFEDMEHAVKFLEAALPLGLWGANIPDFFTSPDFFTRPQ